MPVAPESAGELRGGEIFIHCSVTGRFFGSEGRSPPPPLREGARKNELAVGSVRCAECALCPLHCRMFTECCCAAGGSAAGRRHGSRQAAPGVSRGPWGALRNGHHRVTVAAIRGMPVSRQRTGGGKKGLIGVVDQEHRQADQRIMQSG